MITNSLLLLKEIPRSRKKRKTGTIYLFLSPHATDVGSGASGVYSGQGSGL